MFNRIGLITNSGVKAIQTTLTEVIEYLSSREQEIVLDKCCAGMLKDHNFSVYDAKDLGQHCDLVIAIGGDGTMLMASHILCDYNVPLLGINLGHVGFLSRNIRT